MSGDAECGRGSAVCSRCFMGVIVSLCRLIPDTQFIPWWKRCRRSLWEPQTKPFTKSVSKWFSKKTKKWIHCALSILQYSQLDQLSVSAVSYAKEDGKFLPLVICKEYYRQGNGNHSEETYDIDVQTESGDYCVYTCEHLFSLVLNNFSKPLLVW